MNIKPIQFILSVVCSASPSDLMRDVYSAKGIAISDAALLKLAKEQFK